MSSVSRILLQMHLSLGLCLPVPNEMREGLSKNFYPVSPFLWAMILCLAHLRLQHTKTLPGPQIQRTWASDAFSWDQVLRCKWHSEDTCFPVDWTSCSHSFPWWILSQNLLCFSRLLERILQPEERNTGRCCPLLEVIQIKKTTINRNFLGER